MNYKGIVFKIDEQESEKRYQDKGVYTFQGNAKCRESSAELRGPKSKLPAAGEPMRSLPAPATNPREAWKLEPPVSQNVGTKLLKTRGKSDPLHHTHLAHPAGGRRVSTESQGGSGEAQWMVGR